MTTTNPHLVSHMSGGFVVMLSVVVILLFLNSLANLIYRVINLAGLSIAVVGTWAYASQLSFLYIVYILAFVGAVVMLFLSVVLMLPASTMAQPGQRLVPHTFVWIVTENSSACTEIPGFYIGLYLLLLILGLATCRHLPDNYVYTVYVIKNIIKDYKALISACFGVLTFHDLRRSLQRLVVLGTDLLCLNAPTDVFGAYVKNPANLVAMPALTKVGMHWQNFLYYIYIHIEAPAYNGYSRSMYKHTAPIWGTRFMVFEFGYAPARSMRLVAFPIQDVRKPYTPLPLHYSLFRFLPYTLETPLLSYVHSNRTAARSLNRLSFFANLVLHFIVNIPFNFLAYFYISGLLCYELIWQFIIMSVLTTTALPIFFSSPSVGLISEPNVADSESLAAIKDILYQQNPLYLLLPVTGLLIALIGSAVFTRPSKNNTNPW